MKKKLVFFIYVASDKDAKSAIAESKILSLHYENLKRFAGVFDEALFVLSMKKEFLGNKELVISWANVIMEMGYLNVRFKVEENTDFRESKTLYEDVINGEGNDEKLVFFGHSKGISNELNESLVRLICSMYYFGLSFPEEVNEFLIGREHVYYGFPLLNAKWSTPGPMCVMPTYRYYYYGTFFWINVSLLKELMRNKKREFPQLVSRFYSENFPANTVEFELSASHNNGYGLSGRDLHQDFDGFFEGEYCKYTFDGEKAKEQFNAYCKDIKGKIGFE